MNTFISKAIKLTSIISLCLMMSACISTLVGAVVDTTIAVVKIPFKVGAAVIDVVTPDDLSDEQSTDIESIDSEEDAAIQMESEGI